MNPHLEATITFLTGNQGGFQQPPRSGVKPHLKIDNVFTSCIVWGQIKGQLFEPGIEYNVNLELPFWKEYGRNVYAGMPIQLYQGLRLVAQGAVKGLLETDANNA